MKEWETKSGVKVKRIIKGRSNIYLVTDGLKSIIFDTGIGNSNSTLIKALQKNGIESLDYIALSHTHFDHVGNLIFLKSKYGAAIIVHGDEEDILRTGLNKLPRGTNWFTKLLITKLGDKHSKRIKMPKCRADIIIKTGYSFKEVGLDAEIILTPGHTVGSLSLLVGGEIALVGDALVNFFPGSVYPPFADDTKILINSWRRLLETNCNIFLPAHGNEIGRDKLKRELEKRSF